MPKYIVKLNDYYFEYSTVVDSPVTFGMSLDDFKDYYQREYGDSGTRGLEERLQRVEKYGASAYGYTSVNDVLKSNSAGPNEDCLTIEEIYQAYCLRKPIRNGWLP